MKQRILVFRFSAMGDVAMTSPVLKEFAEQNPDVELLIISRKLFKPFFKNVPNSIFIDVDFNNYKGILGLRKLANELMEYKPTMIADLHNVLRTTIIKFFINNKVKRATLYKNRIEKKLLTQKTDKVLKQLKSMPERYADVFRELGFSINLSNELKKTTVKNDRTIGIAPFANYNEKMYPLYNMKKVIYNLAKGGVKIKLFGGGENEKNILKELEKNHENIESFAGKFTLEQEMEEISKLNLMISMDSANMHIASIVGTRVISIWGATHYYAGFLGYGQKKEDIIDIELECRPCSVFGNKECYRKDLACMNGILPETITNKIISILKENDKQNRKE